MPPVAVAVAASAIASSVASGITIAALNAGFLAVANAAFFSSVVTGAVGFGISKLGTSLISGGGKKGKGGGGAGGASDLQSGIKQVVRLSDDTYKLIYGRARVGGVLAFAESAETGLDSDGVSQSGDNLFLHLVIIHAPHEIDAFEQVYLNDDLVTLDGSGFVNEAPYKKDGKSYVRIRHHYGETTQVADSQLVLEAPNWTTDHRLRGLAYTYMRLQWNGEVFTSGIPNLNVVIRGKKVYDPRTTLTAWSNNAALCINDYLRSRDDFDVPYGFGASADEVDSDFTIAAANICDELVTKLDSSTIARYTLNGAVDTANTPISNIEDMMSSMAGVITYPKGKFRIYAGAYNMPEADVIDESWLAGDIDSQNRLPRSELFNAVRGTFINPDKSWQKDDFPALTSAAYETQDNGERIFTDIELPYTTDSEAAQRIAKIAQRKSREQISVTMLCNYRALQFTVWDVVKVNNTTRGWTEKEFRIIDLSFDITGGVALTLREENSSSYSWTASDGEAIANAPDTDLPSPTIVNVPSSVAYDSRAVLTVGGDTVYNLVLTWAAYSNAFVQNGGSFEVQFKLSSDAEWRPSFYVDGSQTATDIPSTTVNVEYDLRIRAVNMLGAKSNWVEIYDAMIGSTGGVISSLDWGAVNVSPAFFNDYGNVTDAPTTFNDWGSVI